MILKGNLDANWIGAMGVNTPNEHSFVRDVIV